MNQKSFDEILTHNPELDDAQLKYLRSIVKEYPYFQSARALQLKQLYQNSSLSYNAALKKTAAYTTDRRVLFDYITSRDFHQQHISTRIKKRHNPLKKKKKLKKQQQSFTIDSSSAGKVLDPHLFKKTNPDQSSPQDHEKEQPPVEKTALPESKVRQEKSNNKPVHFDKTQEHSFAEWLNLTKAHPISRKEEQAATNTLPTRKGKLIDQFIANAPKKISPKAKPGQINIRNYKLDNHLMTETLAEVYTQQKNYSKAIQAYKILILKNPEKSGLFADRIREIEISREKQNK